MLHEHRSHAARTTIDKNLAVQVAFWAIVLLGCALRLQVYGDPRRALATIDTQSYIDSARAPLLSMEDFAGRRLFTTNLLYKVAQAGSSCDQIAISMPAIGKEAQPEIRPCYAGIALLQALLSTAGWIWLAFALSRHLTSGLGKLLAAVLILLFGLTPQIAEWDNILGSESITLSLFALSFGFLIEIAFAGASQTAKRSGYLKTMYVLWLIFFSLWLFVRDANLYAIPVTVALLLPLLFTEFKAKRPVLIAVLALTGLFILGLVTSKQSPRWPPSIENSFSTFIDPFPSRVQFLRDHFGMPDPSSAAYQPWFMSHAPTAYTAFLLAHPGFVVTTIGGNWTIFSHSYEQPYFTISRTRIASPLSQFGEVLHPDSGLFYLLDTIVLISFVAAAATSRTTRTITWMWLFAWFYLTAALTLFVSFFGDTGGIMRHVFPSVEDLRLFMWMSLLVLIDGYIRRSDAVSPAPAAMPTGNDISSGADR